MIFSYGFLEDTLKDARQLFLPLDIPDDDPLKRAKKVFCKDAPGVRLFTYVENSAGDRSSTWPPTGWDSSFIWWSCVNEEDGLDFSVLQTRDGGRELRVSWKGCEVGPLPSPDIPSLSDVLKTDPMWDMFQLRATVMLQERVSTQLSLLETSDDSFRNDVQHDESGSQTNVRTEVYNTVKALRDLETRFFRSVLQSLERDVGFLFVSLSF